MSTIAVTGATGGVGGRVAARLARAGADQVLVVRDASRAPDIEGAAVRQASDYAAGDEMRAALAGVQTLFLVPGGESLDRVQRHATAIDAAVAAGVERIVYLGFIRATPDSTFTLARHHAHTEDHIRASGVPAFTFLRASLYLDFVPLLAGADGVIAGPAGDGRVAIVARDDIADVAAAVLTAPPGEHDGRGYDLTGSERLTLAEAADRMARSSAKPIVFRDETLDEAYASRAEYGAPEWQVESWVTTYSAIGAGELDVVSDTVEQLAGHPPLTLAGFLRAHPDALDHVAG